MRRLTILLLINYGGVVFFTLTRMSIGLPILPILTPVSTLSCFTFCIFHASQRLGWFRAGLLLVTAFLVSLLFESVGVATGLIYGPYQYTDLLGTKFLGLVPYLIPVAWFMMMYPSLVIGERLLAPGANRLALAAIAGLVMTSWDLALDPLMVFGKYWVWDVKGSYFGVPVQNFLGWWLTSFVVFGVYLSLFGHFRKPRRMEHTDYLLRISYLITGAGTVISCLIFGLEGPALVGAISMAPWAILPWVQRPGVNLENPMESSQSPHF
jgi:uncharacterized membrane protein